MAEVSQRLQERGISAFEAELLADRWLVGRGVTRFVAIRTLLFHPGELPRGAVELGLRFDLADQERRPLRGFGVSSELAIKALGEAKRVGEELPIPAVAIEPGQEPARRAELVLTVSFVQVAEEPEPQPLMCFSVARQDHTPLYSFAMGWRRAMFAMSMAFEVPPGQMATLQPSARSRDFCWGSLVAATPGRTTRRRGSQTSMAETTERRKEE